MKQVSTKIINYDLKRRLFIVIFPLFLIFSLLYIYFVGNVVFDAIGIKNLKREIQIVNIRVGELELDYLSSNNAIDLELSRKLGFREPENTYFVTRVTVASTR